MTVTYHAPTYCSLKLIKGICWLGLDQFFDLGYVTLLPLNHILFLWKMEVIIPSPQGCLRIQWEGKLWKELSKHSGTCSKWELFLCLIFLVLCGSVLSHSPVSPVKGQKFWGFGALSQKGRMHNPLSPFYPQPPGFIMYLIIYPIPLGLIITSSWRMLLSLWASWFLTLEPNMTSLRLEIHLLLAKSQHLVSKKRGVKIF